MACISKGLVDEIDKPPAAPNNSLTQLNTGIF